MPHTEPGSTQVAVHSEGKEDVKPQTLPITESNLPIHHSGGEHYPVLVMKTEDAPFGTHVPVVIPEEKPHIGQQTITGDDAPAQLKGQSLDQRAVEQKNDQELVEQSYNQKAAEEPLREQETDKEHSIVEDNQEQRVLHSQEETEASAMYEPGDVVEQMREQRQEEIAEDSFADQGRFAPEDGESIPAQDASVPWAQETTPMDTQEPDEFYTPEEQNIPQSHSYAEEYQEEFYNGDVLVSSSSEEPWVMVDHPQAPEQENYSPPHDDVGVHLEEPVEMLNERFAPEVPEEVAEQVYHNEEEGVEVEEAEETPAVEVSTCSWIWQS